MIVLLAYVVLFAGLSLLARALTPRALRPNFGDAQAVRPSRWASVVSVLVLFLIWGAFTGSRLVPLHVPGPFVGETGFTYDVTDGQGGTGRATVHVQVTRATEGGAAPQAATAAPADAGADTGTGIAHDDQAATPAWRSALIKVVANDGPGAKVVAINGQPIAVDSPIRLPDGLVVLTPKGSLSFTPNAGWQMEPIWLPAPEAVAARFVEIAQNGYQNFPLWVHLGFSIWRVLAGLVLGTLVGVPLGYAMGLSGWVRGWFDPIVEFMRPVPPLALIPLVIIWFGIWEAGKIVLLFLAALWIMVIAARNGISGTRLSKVHAALSLGASKTQVLWHVLIPNSLPDIFTGLRVALGVCWGTVVAAELVAAEKGAGMLSLIHI